MMPMGSGTRSVNVILLRLCRERHANAICHLSAITVKTAIAMLALGCHVYAGVQVGQRTRIQWRNITNHLALTCGCAVDLFLWRW
jgi:hypothetical protein